MKDARIGFGILGPVELTVDGVPQPIGGPKQRAVLAYLVLHANHPVSVDAIAAAVWEDRPPSDARTSLHTIASNLRKPLRDNGLDARSILAQIGSSYRVATASEASDAQRFTARRQRGLRALESGRFAEASELLSGALDQWRGPALADLRGTTFADTYAEALEDDRLTVLQARAAADIARGKAAAVVSEFTVLAGHHPLREGVWAQLIAALYADGRQSEALEAVRRLRATLAGELGVDPGAEIRDLEQRILRQEPLIATVAVPSTTIVDLGEGLGQARLCDVRGQEYPITQRFTRIGRGADNDIVLDDRRVSRKHAALLDTGAGFVIRDLLSANGIRVDGERIVESARLRDGAVIGTGGHELVFRR